MGHDLRNTNTTTRDSAPPFQLTSAIELVSVDHSKIVNVSLYAGHAEITRLYKFHVKTGQNHVTINGLPNVLDRNSLRVKGRGAATIHDVTLSDMPTPTIRTDSAALEDLLARKEWNEKALYRCKKSLVSLEGYLLSSNVQHMDVMELGKVMDSYDLVARKLDEKLIELEASIKDIEKQIASECDRLAAPGYTDHQLRLRATIGIFAGVEDEVEIVLVYAVYGASWSACYDVRVDMQTKDTPVALIYKAAITQNTGEAWDNVPLTLETAAPTFGIDIPTLLPWTLSVYTPPTMTFSVPAPRRRRQSMLREVKEEVASDKMVLDLLGGDHAINHRAFAVSSRGNVSATFEVPGVITIPSDGAAHNVTVAQLKFDATMSWVTVPKIDTRAHLKATLENDSDYTLLPGTASVYVDGSFISRSNVPLVSPQESFDCPLGLDPSIRVTYHPLVKKVSHTRFYTKAFNHVFSQRITVFNIKSSAIDNFKVVDQLPVSETSQITVKLVSPGLTIPKHPPKGGPRTPPFVKVSGGVVAQWEDTDEQGFDTEALGRDGKLSWVCSVPPHGKTNLLLEWEVNAPARTELIGL